MLGVIGYDSNSRKYWYVIRSMGIEVDYDSGLTQLQMDQVKQDKEFVKWRRDYDYDI